MAKATKIAPKPVKQPPAKIMLELSEGEADFILGLLDSIGGSPTNSPRKYADCLNTALSGALGHGPADTDAHKLIDPLAGRKNSIYFREYGSTVPKAPVRSLAQPRFAYDGRRIFNIA
jgi:hypothetical protein